MNIMNELEKVNEEKEALQQKMNEIKVKKIQLENLLCFAKHNVTYGWTVENRKDSTLYSYYRHVSQHDVFDYRQSYLEYENHTFQMEKGNIVFFLIKRKDRKQEPYQIIVETGIPYQIEGMDQRWREAFTEYQSKKTYEYRFATREKAEYVLNQMKEFVTTELKEIIEREIEKIEEIKKVTV